MYEPLNISEIISRMIIYQIEVETARRWPDESILIGSNTRTILLRRKHRRALQQLSFSQTREERFASGSKLIALLRSFELLASFIAAVTLRKRGRLCSQANEEKVWFLLARSFLSI